MAKRKRKLTAEEIDRVIAIVEEVQREVRELLAFLRARVERRPQPG